jgi:AcrR family transcriptional regulator
MARPPDPQRRARVLSAATDYVLQHGLGGLSLRPLAAALDTSPRMLLYDFDSKETLLSEILLEARRRQVQSLSASVTADSSLAQALRLVWRWVTEHLPYAQLLFEVYLDAQRRPEVYTAHRDLVDDWIGYFTDTFGIDSARATLILAVFRGLAMDRLSAADDSLTDRAMEAFSDMLLR